MNLYKFHFLRKSMEKQNYKNNYLDLYKFKFLVKSNYLDRHKKIINLKCRVEYITNKNLIFNIRNNRFNKVSIFLIKNLHRILSHINFNIYYFRGKNWKDSYKFHFKKVSNQLNNSNIKYRFNNLNKNQDNLNKLFYYLDINWIDNFQYKVLFLNQLLFFHYKGHQG